MSAKKNNKSSKISKSNTVSVDDINRKLRKRAAPARGETVTTTATKCPKCGHRFASTTVVPTTAMRAAMSAAAEKAAAAIRPPEPDPFRCGYCGGWFDKRALRNGKVPPHGFSLGVQVGDEDHCPGEGKAPLAPGDPDRLGMHDPAEIQRLRQAAQAKAGLAKQPRPAKPVKPASPANRSTTKARERR